MAIRSNYWPPAEAFIDVSGANQISDGRARCVAVALCDEQGQPLHNFYLGQPAHVFYEFEVLDTIDAPGGGLEIIDANDRVIHGKNSFQYGISAPRSVAPGTRLRYHQIVHLELGAGEYRYSVTLASVDGALYDGYRLGTVAESVFRPAIREHCRVQGVGSFTVEYHPTVKLLHHGLANLPGAVHSSRHTRADKAARDYATAGLALASDRARWVAGWRRKARRTMRQVLGQGDTVAPAATAPAVASTSAPSADRTAAEGDAPIETPTIVHVTHWKAGSQWIYQILDYCMPDRIVVAQVGEIQFLHWPIQPGKVYPTVYVTKQQFDQVKLPHNSHRFVVIRDLRDTLISGYFSIKVSHSMQTWMHESQRTMLRSLDLEEGLIYLMDEWLTGCARIQMSWLEAEEPVLRYEDLLEHDLDILERVLLDECHLPVSRQQLHRAVVANRFENLTGGRARGEEEVTAHVRKGVAGDWRNYFTERVKRAFKLRYGGLLVAAGYERDVDW